MNESGWIAGLALCACLGLAGCGQGDPKTKTVAQKDDHAHDHAHAHDHDEGHEHSAPHGGTLVVLGDHFAHFEFVLDAKAGKLTCYVLDGEAEKGIPLEVPALEARLTMPDGTEKIVAFKGVASELTGEKANLTSQFDVQDELLKGAEKFRLAMPTVRIKAQPIKPVTFDFPAGNEPEHKPAAKP
ncbi:MAG: hypothetical protein M5U26_15665 [Planctomycetota bacterium]|nr:hypothetical protein [Planctomycetota bacterium]